MQQKSQQKVQAIKTLCTQLQVDIIGKQMITESGFVENTVLYMDREQYPVDKEEPKVPEPAKEEPKKDEKTTNIRK